ncbi:hypothetical protein PSTG_02545 [Puccinia striiformis f. sp. tritici PST-78]|uniref:Uncharacterized protein n=1 Tax=Puccinia striiformis f. sp. tritici PST-78 TaxID=1165861 RepID=A0A0L0VY51_9BASI|nr:hypothetical protein PSTG_02545 [Puccinia striiformis f. sp. tritici PST-78]
MYRTPPANKAPSSMQDSQDPNMPPLVLDFVPNSQEEGFVFGPKTQPLKCDESQATEDDFPESIPAPDGSEMYCEFDFDYSVWAKRHADSPFYSRILLTRPPKSLRISVSGLAFEDFKMKVIAHLAPSCDNVDVASILRRADKANMLQWICVLDSDPLYGRGKHYVATDTISFNSFAVKAALALCALDCAVKIVMEKPPEEPVMPTPPQSGRAVRFIDHAPPGRNDKKVSTAAANQLTSVTAPLHPPTQIRHTGQLILGESTSSPTHFKRTLSSDDLELITKRFKVFQQHQAPQLTISMKDFLCFCYLPVDDPVINELIKRNRFHHWTVFLDLSFENLQVMGFFAAEIMLINRGIARLLQDLDEFKSSSSHHCLKRKM